MKISGEVAEIFGSLSCFLILSTIAVWTRGYGLWDDPPTTIPTHVQVGFTVVCVVFMVCALFQDQIVYCIWWLLTDGPSAPPEVVPQQGMWKKASGRGVSRG